MTIIETLACLATYDHTETVTQLFNVGGQTNVLSRRALLQLCTIIYDMSNVPELARPMSSPLALVQWLPISRRERGRGATLRVDVPSHQLVLALLAKDAFVLRAGVLPVHQLPPAPCGGVISRRTKSAAKRAGIILRASSLTYLLGSLCMERYCNCTACTAMLFVFRNHFAIRRYHGGSL